MMTENLKSTFVIVGGGISGVTCAESLTFLAPQEQVILITSSSVIKAVTNIIPLGKNLMQFDVEERSTTLLKSKHPMIIVIHDTVVEVNTIEKLVILQSDRKIKYTKLCLCTGARPKLISEKNEHIIGIRDTESVENFAKKLEGAKRIVIVGNGGIATELAHELVGLQITWVIKDSHISATFVDPGAAEFFQEKLSKKNSSKADSVTQEPMKRIKYTVSSERASKRGPALGPDWHSSVKLKDPKNILPTSLNIEYQCEILEILDTFEPDKKWPIYARLTNGKIIGCDFIVSATGVVPNSNFKGLEATKKGPDGGFLVDWKMETSESDVYAAGDVCSVDWDLARNWFQMRLWTQAHQMGRYVAKSMISTLRNEEFFQDFCFELFTHVTRFFGYKVILLGLYNGQKLDKNYDVLLRVTKGEEYVKLVMVDGKMQGAVLIGETNLEEMCENLILNQLDLNIYGKDLLNPNIDIEDYFD